MLRWLLPISFFALTASTATAHHVVSGYGIAWIEPVSYLELDLQAGFYDHGSTRGAWQLAALRAEHAFHPRLSAYVRAPFGRIDPRDDAPTVGIGDVEVGLRGTIYGSEDGKVVLSGGFGFEMPTGNPGRRFGNGHFELTPFLTLSVAPLRRLAFFSLVSYRTSFGNPWRERHDPATEVVWDEDGVPRFVPHTHGAVFDPHSKREMFARVGVAYVFDRAYLSAGVDQVIVFDDSAPRGPTVVRGEIGYLPIPRLRIAGGSDVNVAGERRFDVLGRVGVAWLF